MSEKPEKPSSQNPADVAREAFRRLATRRIAPTPDSYREIYNEIVGAEEKPGPDKVLETFGSFVTGLPGEVTYFGQRLQKASAAKEWDEYGKQLTQLIEKLQANLTAAESAKPVAAQVPAPPPPLPPAFVGNLSEDQKTQVLRDMLVRTLTFAVASLFQGAPELAEDT
jgi:diguanylate cyclase